MKTFNELMLTSFGDKTKEWDVLKLHYYRYINNSKTINHRAIPKEIHQIWLGSPLPEKYIEFCNSWKNIHPQWNYNLWTDAEVEKYDFKTKNAYIHAKNPGAKSDILRYAILEKFGGVYVDTDFLCLKPLDALNNELSFYTGIHDYSHMIIPNGLIATIAGHPIIKSINNIMESITIDNSVMENCDSLMEITGPGLFTRCVMDYLQKDNNKKDNCVVFPASYFYPAPHWIREKGIEYMNGFIKKETLAIHYWEVSWTKNQNNDNGIILKKMYRKFRTQIKKLLVSIYMWLK